MKILINHFCFFRGFSCVTHARGQWAGTHSRQRGKFWTNLLISFDLIPRLCFAQNFYNYKNMIYILISDTKDFFYTLVVGSTPRKSQDVGNFKYLCF